ncbi:MAG TPA: transposase [Anaerolineae bacterium]|nr:transposase [Anaerolineae bacterium]
MSSPPPLEHNTYYHIFNRGNNRENLFKEERNYPYFLKLNVHHIEPVADTFAYCLLPNHFHLLVRVKSETETLTISETFRVLSPSQQFSNLFNAYTKAINKTYRRTGSLFEHPFGRIPITSEQYFTQLVTTVG